jgi:hypothetical protein
VIKEAISAQNIRMASMPASERSSEKLSTLMLEDLSEFKVLEDSTGGQRIGFRISKQ